MRNMITHREIMRVITIALTDRVPRLTVRFGVFFALLLPGNPSFLSRICFSRDSPLSQRVTMLSATPSGHVSTHVRTVYIYGTYDRRKFNRANTKTILRVTFPFSINTHCRFLTFFFYSFFLCISFFVQ